MEDREKVDEGENISCDLAAKEIEKGDSLVVFYTENCPACELVLEKLPDVEVDSIDDAPDKVITVGTDCPDLHERFGVESYPTVLRVVDGVVIGRAEFNRPMSEEEFLKEVEKIVNIKTERKEVT